MPDALTVLPLTLMYHSVSDSAADPYQITVTPNRFTEHMRWLRRARLRGASMRELLNAARQGSVSGLIGLTFDDGYADFSTEVLPVLNRYGFTATVFVVAGNLGGRNDWDAGPAKPLMTADQVRDAARMGIEIGSHGMNHRSLVDADPALLASEVSRSREVLQSLLGTTVDGFCYPYGELSDAAVMATREAGYDYAVATWQTARRDRHALPRTYVGQRDRGGRLLAKGIRHRLSWGGRS